MHEGSSMEVGDAGDVGEAGPSHTESVLLQSEPSLGFPLEVSGDTLHEGGAAGISDDL